jgi:hypothetical protein
MSMRIALFGLFLAGCATDPPPQPWLPPTPAQCAAPAPVTTGQLQKQHVVAAMSCVRPRVTRCYDLFREVGMAVVHIVVESGGGAPQSITVVKKPGSGTIDSASPEGQCVAKAVSEARFPSFVGEPMPIDYPFILR